MVERAPRSASSRLSSGLVLARLAWAFLDEELHWRYVAEQSAAWATGP